MTQDLAKSLGIAIFHADADIDALTSDRLAERLVEMLVEMLADKDAIEDWGIRLVGPPSPDPKPDLPPKNIAFQIAAGCDGGALKVNQPSGDAWAKYRTEERVNVTGAAQPQMRLSCESCRFWDADMVSILGDSKEAYCRKHAPFETCHDIFPPYAVWPRTASDEWCGDYQARPGLEAPTP